MLINRVMMIHVELGLCDDAAEFRNGLAEHPCLVHATQDQGWVPSADDCVQDQLTGFFRTPNFFVEPPQIARDRRQGIRMNVLALAPRNDEQPQHV